MEVQIDHGTLTAKEPHLLPETGAGLLTIIPPEESPLTAKTPVELLSAGFETAPDAVT